MNKTFELFEDRSVEIIQSKEQKVKGMKKNEVTEIYGRRSRKRVKEEAGRMRNKLLLLCSKVLNENFFKAKQSEVISYRRK